MYSNLGKYDFSIRLSHLNPCMDEFLVPFMLDTNSLKIVEVKKGNVHSNFNVSKKIASLMTKDFEFCKKSHLKYLLDHWLNVR